MDSHPKQMVTRAGEGARSFASTRMDRNCRGMFFHDHALYTNKVLAIRVIDVVKDWIKLTQNLLEDNPRAESHVMG